MNSGRAKLLVYSDEDYLIPIIVDEDGKLCKYEATGDSSNRLWLYFQSSPNGVFYDKAFKNRALFKEDSFYCNLWGALTTDETVSIGNQERPFWDLLRASSFIKDIIAFWGRSTTVSVNCIPTVYLFADSEVITDDAKSHFIEKMEQEGFAPVSFSVNPIIPICKYIQKEISSFKPSFGDSVLFLSSVGETLRFSSAVFDGESFLTDGRTRRVDNFGDAPLKNALIRYVVDSIDRSCGGIFATPARKEAEYRFQLRNADKWFNIRRDRNGDFDVDDFKFSFDPESQSPRTTLVRGSFLEAEQEDTVRQAIEKIKLFVNEVLRKDPCFIVFSGEAFEDDSFSSKILQKLEIKEKIILTTNTFAKALFQYFNLFPDKEERFNNFKKISLGIQRENKGVSEWIRNASRINAIEKDLSICQKDLEDALKSDDAILQEMLNKCAAHLRKSRFEEARKALSLYELPSSRVVNSKKDALSVRSSSIEMAPIYERIEVVGKARQMVIWIHSLEDKIQSLSSVADENASCICSKLARIDELEEKHPEYLVLKWKFEREKDFRTRKALLEKMRAITEEELPEITLPHVSATLSANIVISGKFCKKTKILKFQVDIDSDKQLPCDAELHIATKSLTSVEDRMCFSIDIPKGTAGSFSGELKLPHQFVEPKKTIYLYLFPNESVIDKNAIKADFIYVKQ